MWITRLYSVLFFPNPKSTSFGNTIITFEPVPRALEGRKKGSRGWEGPGQISPNQRLGASAAAAATARPGLPRRRRHVFRA